MSVEASYSRVTEMEIWGRIAWNWIKKEEDRVGCEDINKTIDIIKTNKATFGYLMNTEGIEIVAVQF